jgi:hypothetical protein
MDRIRGSAGQPVATGAASNASAAPEAQSAQTKKRGDRADVALDTTRYESASARSEAGRGTVPPSDRNVEADRYGSIVDKIQDEIDKLWNELDGVNMEDGKGMKVYAKIQWKIQQLTEMQSTVTNCAKMDHDCKMGSIQNIPH